jgi:hypothetical protein
MNLRIVRQIRVPRTVKRSFDAKSERVEHNEHYADDITQHATSPRRDVEENHPKKETLGHARCVAEFVHAIELRDVIGSTKEVGRQHPQDRTEQHGKSEQPTPSPPRLAPLSRLAHWCR